MNVCTKLKMYAAEFDNDEFLQYHVAKLPYYSINNLINANKIELYKIQTNISLVLIDLAGEYS